MSRHFPQPLETGPLVTLEHGPYQLTVAPGFGARMVAFRHGSRDILRPTPDSVLAKPVVYGFAGFPLMPYSGPLFGPGFAYGGFAFAGVAFRLPEPFARNRRPPTVNPGLGLSKFSGRAKPCSIWR